MKKTYILQVDDTRSAKQLEDFLWNNLALEARIVEPEIMYAAKIDNDPKSPVMLFVSDPGLRSPYFKVAKVPE